MTWKYVEIWLYGDKRLLGQQSHIKTLKKKKKIV
jgi:hypothetical protein